MNYTKLVKYHMKHEQFKLLVCFLMLGFMAGIVIYNKYSVSGFLVIAVLFLFFVGKYFYKKFMLSSNYFQLSKNEKLELDKALQSSLIFNGKDYAISKKFIIDYKNCSIINLDSVLIIEQVKGKYFPSVKSHNIADVVYLYTKSGRIYRLINRSYQYYLYESYYEHLYDYVKKQNPNVLEGYTKENRKIIKEKYNVNI